MEEDLSINMNLHPKAIEYREDFKILINMCEKISENGFIQRLCQYLEDIYNAPIHPNTILNYANASTPPAWLMDILHEFLNQKPYIDNPILWWWAGQHLPASNNLAKAINKRVEIEMKKKEEEREKLEKTHAKLA